MTVEKQELFAEIHQLLLDTSLFAAGSLLMAIILLLSVLRPTLIKPITSIVHAATALANVKHSITKSSDRLEVITQNIDAVQTKTNVQMDSVMQTASSVDNIITQIHHRENAVSTQVERIARSSESIEPMVQGLDTAHAGEVRKLAESSNQESTSISQEIKEMQRGIAQIRQVTAETTETLNRMFREVRDMQRSFHRVNKAVDVQASDGSEVLDALRILQEKTEQVRRGTEELQKASRVIHKVIEHLKDISQDVHERTVDVQQAGKRIAASLNIAARLIGEGTYGVPPVLQDPHQRGIAHPSLSAS
ncbi:MAG: hypothetical protein LBC51_03380 [Treponema sp.]|nr:hypothetical protein [Treponema sp.]